MDAKGAIWYKVIWPQLTATVASIIALEYVQNVLTVLVLSCNLIVAVYGVIQLRNNDEKKESKPGTHRKGRKGISDAFFNGRGKRVSGKSDESKPDQ
jgi:hypothetical protein